MPDATRYDFHEPRRLVSPQRSSRDIERMLATWLMLLMAAGHIVTAADILKIMWPHNGHVYAVMDENRNDFADHKHHASLEGGKHLVTFR